MNATVQPDGSFKVNNIPIFRARDSGIALQLFRLRAVCLRSGQMVTGQSGFFVLRPGETTGITDVFEGALAPIPAAIDLTAPASGIELGEDIQLDVTAFFLPMRSRVR